MRGKTFFLLKYRFRFIKPYTPNPLDPKGWLAPAFFYTFFLFLIPPAVTLASVDVRRAAFNKSWLDTTPRSSAYIERHYNSRSFFKGIFGRGWCSNIDFKITNIELTNLTANFCLDSEVKFQKHGLAFQSTLFFNNPIHKIATGYAWRDARNTLYQFDPKGRLVSIKYGKQSIQLLYQTQNAQRPMAITSDPVLNVKTQNGFLTSFLDLTYSYNEAGHLDQVKSQSSDSISYNYDDTDNLNSIHKGRTSREIAYDQSTDRVVAQKFGDGCSENYSYSEERFGLKIVSETQVERHCQKKLVGSTKYRLISQFDENQTATLKETKIIGGREKKLEYDHLGRIVRAEINGGPVLRFEYQQQQILPNRISSDRLGTLHLSYRSDGEIRLIQSPEKDSPSLKLAMHLTEVLKLFIEE